MEKISVVVSCYNEEKALPLFYEEMERVRKQDFNDDIEFEYIFDEIKSYGVVYCSLSMTYNGESETVEGATFDVIETDKGWFMVSIDTAR